METNEIQIRPVWRFNAEGSRRYAEAVRRVPPFGAFPHPAMYRFDKADGTPYLRGYVVSCGPRSHRFFLRKAAAHSWAEACAACAALEARRPELAGHVGGSEARRLYRHNPATGFCEGIDGDTGEFNGRDAY